MGSYRCWLTLTLILGLTAMAPAAAGAADARFDAEVQAAKAGMMADPSIAIVHARRAEALAGRTAEAASQIERATAEWLEAEAMVRMDRAADGLRLAIQARKTAETYAPNSKLLGDLLITEGYADQNIAKPGEALRSFQQANAILRSAGDLRGQSKTLQMIGGIYDDAKDYQRALGYYEQASDIYKLDDALALSALNNVGVTSKNLKQFDKAEQYFRRAYAVANRLGSNSLRFRILTNLADCLALNGKLPAARKEISLARSIYATDPSVADWAPFLWGAQAEADFSAGRLDLAAQHIDRTFAGADLAKTTEPFRDFHLLAYRIFKRTGAFARALEHLEAYKRLDDASAELAGSTSGQLASAQFDFTNQNLQLARLKLSKLTEQQKFSAEKDQLTALLLAVFSVALVLAVTAFLVARRGRNFAQKTNLELERLNSSLERAVAARTEFLARTSHEIRTPLNGVVGIAHALLGRKDLTPEVRSLITMLHHCGDSMSALVSDILDMAAIERKVVTLSDAEHDLEALVRDTVEVWRWRVQTKGLRFSVDGFDSVHRVVCDQVKVRQVLDNLLSNAVKFTSSGDVRLQCAVQDQGDVRRIAITVSDTGIGVPADQRDVIFEPFHQVDGSTRRRFEGTGLGLSISRELARLMGGDLVLEDSPAGAVFTFSFVSRERRGPEPAAMDAPRPEGAASLLVIDSNPLNASILRAGLKAAALSIETISHLDAVTSQGEAQDPTIVVVSIDSSDAPEAVVRQVRKRFATARVMALCGPGQRPDDGSPMSRMADAWIEKPIRLPSLIEALEPLVATGPRAAQRQAASRALIG